MTLGQLSALGGIMPGEANSAHTDGQLAYETYTCHVGGELPPWDQLTVTVKAGWEIAAEAVLQSRYAETGELLGAVKIVDDWLDSDMSPDYQAQPLAHQWARVTKVAEEAGEVWKALSNWTGENPRKGSCGTLDDLTGELADTACAAIFAIQHLLKDTEATWAALLAAAGKARARAEGDSDIQPNPYIARKLRDSLS